VRDPHLSIVHDRREMVGGEAVRLEQHVIVIAHVLKHNLAADGIVKHGLALKRHGEPHHKGFAVSLFLCPLLGGEIAAAAVVAGRATVSHLLSA
jgi:hypothetical protein